MDWSGKAGAASALARSQHRDSRHSTWEALAVAGRCFRFIVLGRTVPDWTPGLGGTMMAATPDCDMSWTLWCGGGAWASGSMRQHSARTR